MHLAVWFALTRVATKMVFPPDMGGMAIQEGTKALTKYLNAV